MNEELNQVQIEDEGFFDDYTEDEVVEETPSNTQESEVKSEQVEESQVEESTKPFVQVHYNKELVDLDQDKAIEYAQKGMNYDKVFDKFSNLNGKLEKLASRNGMTVDEYINTITDTQNRYEEQQEFEALKAKYPNDSDELIRELASRNVSNKSYVQAQTQQRQESERANADNAEARRQLDMFMREYPDVDVRKLDQNVINDVNNGYTLLEAYSRWERSEAIKNRPAEEAKAKISKMNEENNKKSLGNTSNAGEVSADDFLSGWNDY